MASEARLDRETTLNLTEGEHVSAMLDSAGWGIVYKAFTDKILDLQNIHNIDDSDEKKMAFDLQARKLAVQYMWDWMKLDVQGRAEQHLANQAMMRDKEGDSSFVETH